jgi:hypothetical protein
MNFQTILVLIIFCIALGYLLRKFVWNPIFESRKRSIGTLDGGKTKCGDKDCACH